MAFLRIFGGRDEPTDRKPDKERDSSATPNESTRDPPETEEPSGQNPGAMTAERLSKLCASRLAPEDFADAFANLTEDDRKRLSSTAQDIFKKVQAKGHDHWGMPNHANGLAKLALLACCPWSQAKRIRPGRLPAFPRHGDWLEAVRTILLNRRPSWAQDWVNLLVDADDTWLHDCLDLGTIHELVNAGVIGWPTADGYIRSLAREGHLGLDPIRDAGFLEKEIWRFFTVESGIFDYLGQLKEDDWARWKYSEQAEPGPHSHEVIWFWPRRLVYWAHQGKLDRNRLIDETLAACWHDFKKPMRNGLVRFVEILELTDDEIAAREAAFRDLVRNDHGPAIGMALASLKRLAASNRLDVAAFLDSASGCFNTVDKGRAKTVLSLIKRLVKENPQHRSLGVRAIAAALNHQAADVQEQAVKLLEKWHAAGASIELAQIADLAPATGAQYRRRLEQLAGAQPSEEHKEAKPSDGDLDRRHRSVLARLYALPEWVRKATCLDGLEPALEKNELPRPFDPGPTECPVLSAVEPLKPLETLDELIDAVGHLFEVVESPEQIERIVDGIMRLGRERPDDFELKTQGLCHAARRLDPDRLTGEVQLLRVGQSLVTLIGRWLGIDITLSGRVVWNPGPHVVFEQRIAACITRFRTQQFGPVLAMPTHRGGWIDPRVFVRRLKSLHDPSRLSHRFDLIAGLLRLAPDFRAAALRDAADLPDPPGRLLRYALGGPERPSESDRNEADEWLAAGRARNPRGVLSELKVLGFGDREPNVITPVDFRFDPRVTPEDVKWTQNNRAFVTQCIDWSPDAIVEGRVAARPTVEQVLLVPNGRNWHLHRDWDDALAASQWPLNPDATLATASCQLMARLDDKSSVVEPRAGILSPLRAVDRGWTEMARTALWLGLLGRDEQARGIALDALIEGIGDGRADPKALAATLVDIASGSWIKIRRLTTALREAARPSILAERVIADILDRWIACWQSYPRDANQVLTLELELLKNLDQGLSPATRAVLFNLEAEGTTAKLAKELISLEPNAASPALRQSAIEAAEGRLARAERIARYAAAN